MEITVHVVNQRLKITTNLESLVAGSEGFVKFVFLLGDDWNGLTKYAQFKQNGATYNKQLDANNVALLPSEIVAGKFGLSLYGSGSGVVATTKCIVLDMDANSCVAVSG